MHEALYFFSALGAFNGIIISIYLFLISKPKTLSKLLLGALILALSIRIGKSVLLYFNPDLPKSLLQLGLSACFFIGPLLYFYLYSAMHNTKKIPKLWLVTLGLQAFLIIAVGYIYSYPNRPDLWNELFIYIIYAVWFVFVIASLILLKPHFSKLFSSNESLHAKEKWQIVIFSFNAIIASLFMAVIMGAGSLYYIIGPIVFSFFIYLMIFGFFYRDKTEFSAQKSISKYANKKIKDEEAFKISSSLEDLMSKESSYQDPNLKISDLANKLSLPSYKLSQVLNDNMGKSYTQYIKEYRINEACKLLVSKEQNMSIEGIGYEVGFKSKSSFYTAFKTVKGLTPAAFQKNKAS